MSASEADNPAGKRPGQDTEAPAGDAPAPAERRDEDGLPLDRAPTLDDVRGQSGSGRTIAVGCTLLVALALLAFWGVRALMLG